MRMSARNSKRSCRSEESMLRLPLSERLTKSMRKPHLPSGAIAQTISTAQIIGCHCNLIALFQIRDGRPAGTLDGRGVAQPFAFCVFDEVRVFGGGADGFAVCSFKLEHLFDPHVHERVHARKDNLARLLVERGSLLAALHVVDAQ